MKLPQITAIREEATDYLKANNKVPPASFAVLVDTSEVQPLLKQHWEWPRISSEDVGPQTLMLFLPRVFSWGLCNLVDVMPRVFNSPQLDLQQNQTYLGWDIVPHRERLTTTIQVAHQDGVAAALNNTYRCQTHRWGWQPVIAVTEESFSMGGFVVDERLQGDLQGAHISAQNHRPEAIYTERRLRIAANRAAVHGLKPWVNDRWQEKGCRRIEPTVLVCQRK